MPDTNSQTLATAASCLSSCIPQGLAWYGVLAVLDAIANGDPVPTTPQEIATAASCLSACLPAGLLPYAIIVAAQNIAAGTGGTGEVLSGVGAPVADPGVTAAIYIDTATGTLWEWYGSAWH